MVRKISYTITAAEAGLRVAQLLKGKGYSEKLITALRHSEGALLVGDEPVFTIYELKEGEVLRVRIDDEKSSEHVVPAKLPLDVVYEDEDILVVNKPAGMPSHPSIEHYEDTLGNAVAWYFKEHGNITFRIINRLDKDTSGLTIIAKNRLSAAILSEEMVNRRIHRTYLALCDGRVDKEGVIDAPIGRVEGSIVERRIDYENGDRAVTHYETLEYIEKMNASLVQLWLETGRTHQIRVHMKHIGHALLGDFLYNPEDNRMPHQALHSYRLEFVHPISKERMKFQTEMPFCY